MSHFNKLVIKEIKRETPLAVSISFEIPESLKKDYQFSAGQYLNIKHIHQGEELRRSYSICSTPNSNEVRIVVKAIENGIFSNYANQQLQVEDTLEVGTPEGRFIFTPDKSSSKNYLGIAAGSGITPIISIAKTTLEEEPNSTFVLIYGNKKPEDTIFYQELKDLQTQYPNRFWVYWTFTQSHPEGTLFGRIDRSTVLFVLKNKHNSTTFDQFYLCGPNELIQTSSNVLKENSIKEEQILYELFTTTSVADSDVKQEGITKIKVTIDGVTSEFEMQKNSDILSAALKQNLDAPYSCQGGICSSCMCRIKEGSSIMKINHILTDDEIEEGLVLACQAYPTTDTIEVDFDDV